MLTPFHLFFWQFHNFCKPLCPILTVRSIPKTAQDSLNGKPQGGRDICLLYFFLFFFIFIRNLRVVAVVFFFLYLFLFFFIFIQNLRVVVVVEEAEAELSINFDFFIFIEQKCAVLPPISSISIGLKIQ